MTDYEILKDCPICSGQVELVDVIKPKMRWPIRPRRKDSMAITENDLNNWFTYHAPTDEQVVKYNNIRNAARVFADVLVQNTLTSADQTAALRKLRECVMTINAAIAYEGKAAILFGTER